jgi:glycosyltransferase involved in cell wall biosynthesis
MAKILIFAGYFQPHEGGSERFALNLARFLFKHKHKVSVITCNTENAKQYEKVGKINVIRVPSWEFVKKRYPVPVPWFMINELGKLEKFDYLITNTRFFNICAYAPFVCWINGSRLIHIEHGTKHIDDSWFLKIANTIYDYTFGLLIMKSADKLFGISKKCQEFIKKISGRSSELVPNCVDTNYFSKVAMKVRDESRAKKWKQQLGIRNELVVTYAGRLIEAKGIQDLINVVKHLKDVKLIILGPGEYYNELKKIAGKNTTIIRKTYTPEELRDLLWFSDFFVNPSYNEGLPTVPLEAGSMELAVIATDVGGTKEIIDNEKNGFLIKPKAIGQLKKKIVYLKENKRMRSKLGKTLRKKVVKNFDLDVAFSRILKKIK